MSQPSAYALVGARLVERGYSAIPIKPGEKRPGEIVAGEWVGMRDWQRFCERLPTELEIERWEELPDAGVGVCLGRASGIAALDFDYGSDEVMAAMEAVIPPSNMKKRGQNGYTAFYRTASDIAARKFLIDGRPVCEILGHGRQTVVPPTLHPCGTNYHWLACEALEETPITELELLPEDIADIIERALAPFMAEPEAPPPRAVNGSAVPPCTYDDTYWSDLKAKAMADLDGWVPELGLPKTRRKADGGYCAVPVFRPSSTGRPTRQRGANLGISPNGIRDFGTDKGYSAIDLVVAAQGLDLDGAVAWLRDRVDPSPEPVIPTCSAPKPKPGKPAAPAVPPLEPWQAEDVPGLVGEITTWILETARRPQRDLALFGALGYCAALFGRRYVSPTRLAPNLYLMTLAGAGYGKEHILDCIKTLDGETDSAVVGPEDVTSDSALEELLSKTPSVLLPIDEVGCFLQGVSSYKAGPWEMRIRSFLLKIFTKSASLYMGKQRVREDPLKIFMPNLSIYGTTTPIEFFKGLTEDNLHDGVIARLLVAEIPKRPGRQEPVADAFEPPQQLIERVRTVLATVAEGADDLAPVLPRMADRKPQPIRVQWDDGAQAMWLSIDDWQTGQMDARPELDGVINRTAELAQKLAMIRAIGVDPAAPVITETDMDWGRDIAMRSVQTIDKTVSLSLSGSQYEEDAKAIYRAISEAGTAGIAHSELRRKRGVSKIRPRDFNEAVTDLQQRSMILKRESTGPKGGRPGFRYWSTDFVIDGGPE